MGERGHEGADEARGFKPDVVAQRVQSAVEHHDEATMARINYILRTDPLGNLPGGVPVSELSSDEKAIDSMISEGGPEVSGRETSMGESNGKV